MIRIILYHFAFLPDIGPARARPFSGRSSLSLCVCVPSVCMASLQQSTTCYGRLLVSFRITTTYSL